MTNGARTIDLHALVLETAGAGRERVPTVTVGDHYVRSAPRPIRQKYESCIDCRSAGRKLAGIVRV